MATQPPLTPDTIEPGSPAEIPPDGPPQEAPMEEPPSVEPPAPDIDRPGQAPTEMPPLD